MGKHEAAAQPFYKAITSRDISEYKAVKTQIKNSFSARERERELMCHHVG